MPERIKTMKTNSIEKLLIKQKEKVDQAIAEYKRLQKQQKAEKAKEQEKLAVKLGAIMHKLIPDVTELDESNFKKFLENTVANDYGKRTLSRILSEQARASAVEVNSAPVKDQNVAATKPTVTVSKQPNIDGNNIDIE